MMANRESSIGVFDSGVGGISVLRSMIQVLPCEHFLYYGDTANAPYGVKTTDEVMSCVRRVVDQLMEQDVKALVIACNTATSVAAETLRQELSLPVIGIEPALKPAAQARRDGAILVMATPVTLSLPKFGRLMDLYGEGAISVPCPGLMDLVEKEKWSGCREYLQNVFDGFDMDKVDGVVLGCTHYVFLKDMIREMLPERILITDGNLGTANQLKRVLEAGGLLQETGEGRVELRSSGTDEDLQIMKRLLGRPQV